ncbi:MAG: holo-ACP synthase [Raoultibacter sp.]
MNPSAAHTPSDFSPAAPVVPVADPAAPAAPTDPAFGGEVGLGVDIVEISRMVAILGRTPSFARKVFSEEEVAYCEAFATPAIHYATRFAAKEAVLKALGTGFSRGISARDVEVKRNAKGKPSVVLHGAAKRVAAEKGVVELPVSLSYTHTDAVACAMAITADSLRAAEQRINPMEELTKRFKDARSLLDEMDQQAPTAPDPAAPADPTAATASDARSLLDEIPATKKGEAQ